jgi:hypothetical protein
MFIKICLAATVLTLLLPMGAAAQTFRSIEVGVLPGQQSAQATDINSRGQVVGISGGEAFIWELATGTRPLGVSASVVLINNAGIVAGSRVVNGVSQLFVWIDGAVFNLPGPPENTWHLRAVTDNGILLVCGSRCWGIYDNAVFDLDMLTGAKIVAVNAAATLGGSTGDDAYLRFWDGRVLIPWRGTTLFEAGFPGPGTVDLIGAGGHFVGRSGQAAWYGMPDGTAFPMGLVAPVRGGFALRDINGRGDVVGLYRPHNLLLQLDTAFLYADGRFTNLSTAVIEGPAEIRDAMAINDTRHIVATATVAGERRSVVLVPNAPPPPSALSAIVSGGVVVLTWTPSTGAEEYFVEAGSTPGARDLYNARVGAVPSLVTAAPPGRYYVRVRARNASGLSAPSNEIVVDVH